MLVNRPAPRGRRCCVEPLETRLLLTAGELIVNGGFETGATGWTASGAWQAGLNNTNFTTYHGGSRYAFYGNASTGATVNNSSGSLFQEIAIPANYSAPTLTFWSRTSTAETTTTAQNDTMVVTVQPAGGGAPIQTLATISNLDGLGVTGGPFTSTGKYTPYEIALPPSLAGQTVRVNFAVSTNASLGTTFRIDDVGVSQPVPVTPGTSGQVVGYIREGKNAFFDQLELSHLTWANYFTLRASSTGELSGSLPNLDAFVTDAHALGIGVSITVGPHSFGTLAASPTARANFATNIKNYILAHDLDGVDIDWEPKPTGVEAYNYGLLIDDLYAQLHPLGKKITAATFPNGRKDLPVAATKLMSWVNVMCYNFHFDDHANYADTIDGMQTWVNYGVAKDKLVLGVPFYGRGGVSWSNSFTRTYGQVIEDYKAINGVYPPPSADSYVDASGTTVYFSGVDTTAAKMQYVRDQGFAGAMMWEPTQDHFDADKEYTPLSLLPILGEMIVKPLANAVSDTAVVTPTAGAGAVSINAAGADMTFTQGANHVTLTGITSVMFNGTAADDMLHVNVDTTLHFKGNGGDDTIHVAADVTFASDAGAGGNATAVQAAPGASITFNTSQHLTALSLSGATASLAPGGGLVLIVGAITIDATGRLDLANNHLLIDYTGDSPYANINGYAVSGRSSGVGIVSATSPDGDRVLAVADNVHLGGTTFRDIPIDDTTIICRYTYYGDANMDGQVTTDDYVAVDLNLGRLDAQWVHGDLDMNGAVTTDDYVVIDLNLGKGTTAPSIVEEEVAAGPVVEAEPVVPKGRKKVRPDSARKNPS